MPKPTFEFTDRMLPILGITWNRFDTESEAKAFAKWAERVTKNARHPCESFIISDCAGENDNQWEVKVRNW